MSDRARNIAAWERWASLAAGAALVVAAPSRNWPGALACAAGGVVLLERGLTGHSRLYRLLGRSARQAGAPYPHDWIDTASDDSFPASDPPSWTSTSSVGSPRLAH